MTMVQAVKPTPAATASPSPVQNAQGSSQGFEDAIRAALEGETSPRGHTRGGILSETAGQERPAPQDPAQDAPEQAAIQAGVIALITAVPPMDANAPQDDAGTQQSQPDTQNGTQIQTTSWMPAQGSDGVQKTQADTAGTQPEALSQAQAAQLIQDVVTILEGFEPIQDEAIPPTFADALAGKIQSVTQDRAGVAEVLAWMPQQLPDGAALSQDSVKSIENLLAGHLRSLENGDGNAAPVVAVKPEMQDGAAFEQRGALPEGEDNAQKGARAAESPLYGAAFSVAEGSLAAQPPEIPPQSVDSMTASIFEQIIEKTSVSLQDGVNQIEIDLVPEFLGRVSIQLTMEGERVSAMIRTSSQQVQGLLASEIGQLQQTLQSRGIEVVQLSVHQQTVGHGTDHHQPGSQAQDGRRPHRGRAHAVQDTARPADQYERIFWGTQPDEHDGVEYRA